MNFGHFFLKIYAEIVGQTKISWSTSSNQPKIFDADFRKLSIPKIFVLPTNLFVILFISFFVVCMNLLYLRILKEKLNRLNCTSWICSISHIWSPSFNRVGQNEIHAQNDGDEDLENVCTRLWHHSHSLNI